jgi:hypothetical protein
MAGSPMNLPRARRVRRYQTTPLGQTDPIPAFTAAAALLDRPDVFVDAGTLLGLWRDRRLIPHDTDIDFAILADEDPPELHGWDLIRTIDHDRRPMQRAYQRDDVIVDLYYYWLDGDTAVNVSDVGILRLPLEHVRPLQPWRWGGISLRIPARPASYLAWRYGPDWQTPKTAKGRWADDAAPLERP